VPLLQQVICSFFETAFLIGALGSPVQFWQDRGNQDAPRDLFSRRLACFTPTSAAAAFYWVPEQLGGCHEEPKIDSYKNCWEAVRRHLGKSLSRFAKASRRSSKGRDTLRITKIETASGSEAACQLNYSGIGSSDNIARAGQCVWEISRSSTLIPDLS
jgi:hypothetical protein